MKIKILLIIFCCIVFFDVVQAQEELDVPQVQTEDVVNCFDYYKFGSVQVDVEAEVASTVSGVPLSMRATIKNSNNYPIVEGAVYAKVFRVQTDEDNAHSNGNFLVDQFFVQDGISLAAKGQKVIDFQWSVPNYASSGEYQIAMFFTSAKKFNLLGLSFTDDVVGNAADFSVSGEIEVNVEFDKNTIDINGTNYHFAAFPPRFKDEDIQIKAELVNFTNESQIIPVTYKLYSWDGQTEENLIETRNETVQIDSQEIKQLAYTIIDKSSPVYYLVVEAQFQDSKSILDIRTVRETANKVRINFPAITNYPLKQNEQNTLFVCTHNSGSADIIENNKLIVTLLDESKQEIHKYIYEGKISGAMMGLKDEFVLQQNYSTFYIKSELYTDDKLVDEAMMKYDCQKINSEACLSAGQANSTVEKKESNSQELIIMIVVGLTIILILAILIYVIVRSRKSGINLFLIFGFIVFSIAFAGAPKVEAKSVVWSDNWNNVTIPVYGILYNPQVSVKYNAVLWNVNTRTSINDGATVPAGTKFKVNITHDNSDISWFSTGYYADSPYGYWEANADQPVANVFLCTDMISGGGDGDDTYYYYYATFSVNPPENTIVYSGTAGLKCDADKLSCEITSPGTIKININFAITNARWWFATKYSDNDGKSWSSCKLAFSPNSPNIPSQSIIYNFTASPSNQPPSIPTITGPNTGITNTNYTFSFSSTDPENNSLRYLVWWSNNDGSAWVGSQWVPSTGTVASRAVQSVVRKWLINGNKRIAVLACDNFGNCSDYAYHTITISAAPVLPCNLPWGGSIASGSSVVAYQNSSVLCNLTCQGETRICTNGILSGTYEEQSCSVDACIDCVSPWGTTVVDGGVVIAYENPSVPCGSSCNSQNRLCVGGTLLGSYQNKECVVDICSSSDSNWVEVAP